MFYFRLPTFYDTVRKLVSYINGEPQTSKFKNILNNLLNDNLINNQKYQMIVNLLESNNKWIDNNYGDVLRWFGYPLT